MMQLQQPRAGLKLSKLLVSLAVTPLVMGAMSISAYAQSMTQKVNLDNVTVFLRGAELFSSGSVRLPAGESEVVFTNVAGRLNEQSLSIAASNGAMVLSTTLRNDYLIDEALSPRAQELKDELEAAQRRREGMQIQLNVIAEQIQVLQANRTLVQGNGSVNAAEIARMLDLIATRMTAALKDQAQINVDIKKLDEDIQKLMQQMEEERSRGYQPGGQIVVRFYSPQATTSQIQMSYVVNDAGWVPAYDLNVTQVGEPIKFTYKANVFQNTGINWTNVKLTLSTGNPSQGVQMPQLYPWQLSIYDPKIYATGASSADARYDMAVLEVAAPVSPAPETTARANFSRVQSNTLEGYVTTNAQGVNTTFNIGIPYTVPSDGKGHMIFIQNTSVPATYQYVVTPKLDSDVFLQARVTDWKGMNLLPGQTNVYFENSFLGHGRIDLTQIEHGLELSLGRDRQIIVERVEDENNRGTAGLFGSSMQRTFTYTIRINNTRKDGIKLIVREQLPVIRDERITLQDLKLAGAEYDKTTGEIRWELDLKAGEQRNITYSFAVRYPKDVNIQGL